MFALARALRLPLVALAGVATFALLADYWSSRRGPDDDKDAGADDASEKARPSVSPRTTEPSRQKYYCNYCCDYHGSAELLCLACLLLTRRVPDNTSRDSYHSANGWSTYRADSETIDDYGNRSNQDPPYIEQEDGYIEQEDRYAEQEYRYYPLEPVETELRQGEKYREMAGIEAKLRNTAFKNSQQSFKSGKKALAKQLSDEGKRYDENVKQYNAQAAGHFFVYHNPGYHSGSTPLALARCDLHGLHVEEALQYALDHLSRCRWAGIKNTMLIVGKGSHSQAGGAKIKPAIMEMLENVCDVEASMHESNEGRIVVQFLRDL